MGYVLLARRIATVRQDSTIEKAFTGQNLSCCLDLFFHEQNRFIAGMVRISGMPWIK